MFHKYHVIKLNPRGACFSKMEFTVASHLSGNENLVKFVRFFSFFVFIFQHSVSPHRNVYDSVVFVPKLCIQLKILGGEFLIV